MTVAPSMGRESRSFQAPDEHKYQHHHGDESRHYELHKFPVDRGGDRGRGNAVTPAWPAPSEHKHRYSAYDDYAGFGDGGRVETRTRAPQGHRYPNAPNYRRAQEPIWRNAYQADPMERPMENPIRNPASNLTTARPDFPAVSRRDVDQEYDFSQENITRGQLEWGGRINVRQPDGEHHAAQFSPTLMSNDFQRDYWRGSHRDIGGTGREDRVIRTGAGWERATDTEAATVVGGAYCER